MKLESKETPHLDRWQSTEGYLWKSAIKERGWTDGAIKKFLGDPDATKDNPHSKRQPPMLLWLESRVKEAEQSDSFQEWQAKRKGQRIKASERMKAVMQAKREANIKEFSLRVRQSVRRGLRIYPSISDLEDAAIANWAANKEAFLIEREGYSQIITAPPREEVEPDTLRRWVCNFARHELSDYEWLLKESRGTVGVNEAYEAMKSVVDREVSSFYAEFSAK